MPESPLAPQPHSARISLLLAWNDPSILNGFFGRTGGVSGGTYATLNLGTRVGDEPRAVDENWRRAREFAPGIDSFARLVQVHGNVVHAVSRTNAAERPEADGMVTSERNLGLAVMTADCVPILLADARNGVVGALHAGWRGTIGGIAQQGVAAMKRLGAAPESTRAALGPSIGQCCFEVDRELANRFASELPEAASHIRDGRVGKAFLDLRGIIRDQLMALGLDANAISSVGPCTKCASERYFSRRAAGGVTTGLQMSFVALAAQ
ncbi:MAG TPA: peptidoglycan editing factor PgeF [Candidatus Binataceae bacterium]|nr:peptidoglycan editing factor PgeF [Candidatus Binataceae bacterium]